MEWIRVDDKLPEVEKDVLLCFYNKKTIIGYLYEDKVYEEGYYSHTESGFLDQTEKDDYGFDDVEYWMSLPNPVDKSTDKEYKCGDCGTEINEGEYKTFGICDDCWDIHLKKKMDKSTGYVDKEPRVMNKNTIMDNVTDAEWNGKDKD